MRRPLPLRRFARVSGPGRPTMHLAVADDRLVTACLTAPDPGTDIAQQAARVLGELERLLVAAGASRDSMLTAEIWLKEMADLPALAEVWNDFVPPGKAPVVSVLRADTSRPEGRVEIRIRARVAQHARPDSHCPSG